MTSLNGVGKLDDRLSDDAKALLGTVFIHGMTLGFGMDKSRPTKRTQSALDEMVKLGAVAKTRHANGRGWKYKACWPSDPYVRWMKRHAGAGQFELAEPITEQEGT